MLVEVRLTQQLIHLTGFTEDIRARGQRPSTKVISATMHPADEAVAEKLRINPETLIFRLQRLRLADGEPLAIELSQITFKDCEKLLGEDLERNSLYRLLETKYGITLMEADQEIEAGLASNEDAQLLKIAPGSSVLYTRRVTYTERNQPVEYARAVYCGHKYTFYTHMRRDQLVPCLPGLALVPLIGGDPHGYPGRTSSGRVRYGTGKPRDGRD